MLPTSLKILDISGGNIYDDGRDHHKFTGGIPPEWGALKNLKQLKMARCGLDGAFGSTRPTTWDLHLTRRAFCAVSNAEQAALKAKLPNCRVYF